MQLCDFGVAGTLDTRVDKRSTFIGTLHWMAPGLFNPNPSYGKEVDIWAFGCMVFEISTGLPPNVGVPFERSGSHSKFHLPRLEGGDYSNELREIVAYCLEEYPGSRPTIGEVQKHSYIWNSNSKFPTSSLSYLVRAFKMWEDRVGSRESLFMPGGGQGLGDSTSPSMADDEWNFSTTLSFDQEVSNQSTSQDVYDAYGTASELPSFFSKDASHPQSQKPSRRRPPPHALARLPAPLEKIFDPNTLSNYEDNSRDHYGGPVQQFTSDLPLRDNTSEILIKDTMIDLGAHDSETGLSKFPSIVTIKAQKLTNKEGAENEDNLTMRDFSRPALSDPVDINNNRRTQDWKFPTISPPASANSRYPRSLVTDGSGDYSSLTRHTSEPIVATFGGTPLHSQQSSLDQLSMRESLIDLDMGLPDIAGLSARPSTANSRDRLHIQ